MTLRIAFFHANGYPPGVYSAFFRSLRTQLNGRGDIAVAQLLATPDAMKPTLRWPHMLGIAQQRAAQSDANVLVGHSMGGYLALQVAASSGARIERVVLIDSPIPRLWRAGILSFSQITGLSYKFGPAPVAERRRDRWPDRAAAKAHFAAKPFVKRWAAGVLDDFVLHALRDNAEGAGVTLTIPRNTEREIYAHLVHSQALDALHRIRNAGVRVSFVAGGDSEEMRLAGYASNKALFAPRFTEIEDAGHLIPFEQPERCAQEVMYALLH
jgi:pimeloyl-ACP methyl ester carboxylesterase